MAAVSARRRSSPPSLTGSPRAARLAVLAALALVAFLGVYAIAVQTEVGQRADEAALTGGREVPDRARSAADRMLSLVSVGFLVAATAGLSALALLRRDPRMLLLPAAIIGLSLIATEILKLWLLNRPELIPDPKLAGNSYPSGHTTVFTSIGLAGLIVAPPRLRGTVAVLAWAAAAGAGVFVLTAEWHRPSDPIGSYLLTLAVTAAVLAVYFGRGDDGAETAEQRRGRAGPTELARRIEWTAAAAAAALFAAALLIATLRYGPDVDWNRAHAAFLLSAAAIVIAAGLVVGALLRALGRAPDPPEARDLR